MRTHHYIYAAAAAWIVAWPATASADTWYYASFSAKAKQVDQQCVRLPAGTTPEASLPQHAGSVKVVSDKTTADQARVLVLSTRSGSNYAFTSTVKACLTFRAPIVAETALRLPAAAIASGARDAAGETRPAERTSCPLAPYRLTDRCHWSGWTS